MQACRCPAGCSCMAHWASVPLSPSDAMKRKGSSALRYSQQSFINQPLPPPSKSTGKHGFFTMVGAESCGPKQQVACSGAEKQQVAGRQTGEQFSRPSSVQSWSQEAGLGPHTIFAFQLSKKSRINCQHFKMRVIHIKNPDFWFLLKNSHRAITRMG